MKINPFRQNSPVNPGMFVGRLNEIKRLEQALIQARHGEPAHFMITGERGIGKTSFLLYVNYLAEGKILYESDKLNFLILDLDIDSNTTQLGLIRRINQHIERVLGKTDPAKKFLKEAWSFLQRIRVMGSGIEKEDKLVVDEVVIDDFALSLNKICDKICKERTDTIIPTKYDGILILIDEADNCSANLQLGSFLKLMLERLQKMNCNNILIGLAGLPELRSKLHSSHPSSLRIFEEIQLGRLSNNEVERVIDICLEKANSANQIKTTIETKAKEVLIYLSEGYPHFIQQFGYSAFAYDNDNIIDEKDVRESALGAKGALNLIGDRYYRNDFYNKIQQESYRQVLRIMADDLDGWVDKAKIRRMFKGKDSVLNNALKALRDRHIIQPKEGQKGVYRLQHKGFALWIKLYTSSNLTQ